MTNVESLLKIYAILKGNFRCNLAAGVSPSQCRNLIAQQRRRRSVFNLDIFQNQAFI
jgi:hypothetical protein